MTTQTYEAIFQNGSFCPLQPLPVSLVEGQQVRLVVEVVVPDVLALAGAVYEGLSGEEIQQVEQIALERRDFFNPARP